MNQVMADKQWTRRVNREQYTIRKHDDLQQLLGTQGRLEYEKGLRNRDLYDTTNNLRIRNTPGISSDKKTLKASAGKSFYHDPNDLYNNYDPDAAATELMNEANYKNLIGPPTQEGPGYLSIYSNNRRRNSMRGGQDIPRTFNRTSMGTRETNGWADLSEAVVEVGRSGVPGPNQSKLGQQRLNMTFAAADPTNFYQNSFQMRANRTKSCFNGEGVFSDLQGMYNMGQDLQKTGFACGRGDTYDMTATASLLPHRKSSNQFGSRRQSQAVRQGPLLQSIMKSTDRYQSRTFKLPHQFQGDPYEKSEMEDNVFKSYQQYHDHGGIRQLEKQAKRQTAKNLAALQDTVYWKNRKLM